MNARGNLADTDLLRSQRLSIRIALVWNEVRFCFVQERDNNLGGNSLYRSEERIATEKRHLKRKWKSHIRLETYKSQDRTAMDVPRRQSVKL
jgi:hypothetical protein